MTQMSRAVVLWSKLSNDFMAVHRKYTPDSLIGMNGEDTMDYGHQPLKKNN